MKKFKSITFFLAVVLLACLVIGCQSAGKPGNAGEAGDPGETEEPMIQLSWGNTVSAEDWNTKTMEMVAERVYERTNGTVKIDIFPANQLGNATTQTEMMIDGNLDMFTEGSTNMQDFGIPEMGIMRIPFLWTKEGFLALLDSDIYASWEDRLLEERGIRTLAHNWMRQPVQIISNKPVRSAADLVGLRLRTTPSPTIRLACEDLGISAVTIELAEVYLSLQQGLVDAAIGPTDMHYSNGFYEICDYLIMIDFTLTNYTTWINEKKFQSMSENQQQILIEECIAAGPYYVENVESVVGEYIKEMEASGVEVIYFDPEARKELSSKALDSARKLEAQGDIPAGVIDSVLEFINK